MKILLTSVAVLALTAVSSAAVTINENEIPDGYSVYEFNVDLGNNNRIVGAFVGNDVDGNRIISSSTFVDLDPLQFPGESEVALIRVEYQGPIFELAGQYDFYPSQFGGFTGDGFEADNGADIFVETFSDSALDFILDGSGLIGNDTFDRFDALTLRLSEDYVVSAGLQPISLTDPFGQSQSAPALFQYCSVQPCAALWRYEPQVIYLDPEGNLSDFDSDPDGEIFLDAFVEESVANNSGAQVTSGPVGDAIGVGEDSPLLPDATGPDGQFSFDVPDIIPPGEIFFIDPEIAVGYTYEVEGTTFTSVQAPTLDAVNDADGYLLVVNGTTRDLAPGELFEFLTPVSSFEIVGIDTSLMLDPDDSMAFITGIALADPSAATSLTQTPQTKLIDDGGGVGVVPLPASALFLLGGLGAFAAVRRRPGR